MASNAYPMKSIDEICKTIYGAKVWSSLDLKSVSFFANSYYRRGQGETAISCGKGLFHLNLLPFGVKNGSVEIVKWGFWRKLPLLPLLWHTNAIDEN